MKSKILNSIGLILGIVGVSFLFAWGPPQPSFESGIGIGLEDNTPIDNTGKTVAEYNKGIKEKEILYSRMSKLGLLLIILGFVFQFVAVLLEMNEIKSNSRKRQTDNENTNNNLTEMLEVGGSEIINCDECPKKNPNSDNQI